MWTRKKLTRSNLKWLKALPQGPVVVDGAFAIAHGTPIDEDAYIFGEIEALNVFRHTDFPICFFGHSHFPVIFALSPDAITTILTVAPSFRFKLQAGRALPDQPGLGGPAARREPARLVRDLRQRLPGRHHPPHPLPAEAGAGEDPEGGAARARWPTAWRSADRASAPPFRAGNEPFDKTAPVLVYSVSHAAGIPTGSERVGAKQSF